MTLIVSYENIFFRTKYPDAVRFAETGGNSFHYPITVLPDCPAHELHIPTAAVSSVGEDEASVTIQNRSIREGVVMSGVTPVRADTYEIYPAIFLIECNLGEFRFLRHI